MIQIVRKKHSTDAAVLKSCQQDLERFFARKEIGFKDLPTRQQLSQSSEALASVWRKKFSDLVIVGIGGSSLGPRVLQEIFDDPKGTHHLWFCDNVDAIEFRKTFSRIKSLKSTGWVFISKSGSTIETLVAAEFINQEYQNQSLNLKEHAAIVSEMKSNPLTDWAKSHSLPQLEIPVDVGGRFSVLTPVGLFPAAFLGISNREMLSGAAIALQSKNEIAEVMAQALQSFKRDEWISFFWFYSSQLKSFGGWLGQLWAESLAKRIDREGKPAARVSTPISAVGAIDQHSLLQQVMEGAKDKFVIFVRITKAERGEDPLKTAMFPHQKFFEGKKMGQLLGAEAEATESALSQEGISTMCLSLSDLSPESVGFLFMFWQLVVAGLGESLNINAFDQPGVELGKRLAKEILQRS